jgi:dolichol-phosphate mannosyltransferase
MRILSIVIPAYNEESSIATLLEKVLRVRIDSLGYEKEVIVVDDGSLDRTAALAHGFPGVICIRQANQGKGKAVQTGIARATGNVVLVQDADLEYDPDDYPELLRACDDSKTAVYGSRVLGQMHAGRRLGRHPRQGWRQWFAGILLSVWTFMLYGCWISDTLTGYKLYPVEFLRNARTKTRGFETDHELTAKLIRGGFRIREVPVRYYPRTVQEGKKIRARDGLVALWTLLRFRCAS